MERSIEDEAKVIDKLIKKYMPNFSGRVWDCSCGSVGIQSVGLAKLGYNMRATDISPRSVMRAMTEADKRGLHINFAVADFRELERVSREQVGVIISFYNSRELLVKTKAKQ